MKNNTASDKQVALINKLRLELGLGEIVDTPSKASASKFIDELMAQASAARLAKWAQEREAKAQALEDLGVDPWAAGRQQIVGKVTKTKESYGPYGFAVKATVQDRQGRKVMFNLPTFAEKMQLEGQLIEVTLTVKPGKDPFFAFGNRPANLTVTERQVAA